MAAKTYCGVETLYLRLKPLPLSLCTQCWTAATTLLLCGAPIAPAVLPPYPQLDLDPGEQRLSEPVMTPASPAGERAISGFSTNQDFEIKLWAAEPMLSNPVSFDFDEQGRFFVSETHRYRSSVLDIRGYMDILEFELASQSIEDRAELIDIVFGEQAEQLALETEVVRLVQNTDGDGVADDSRVFADGFNTKLDGIASGVLARRARSGSPTFPASGSSTPIPPAPPPRIDTTSCAASVSVLGLSATICTD
ncbi:MAG: hypothetical protein J6386_20515 [Candidatus Synoicihabitans palmerolidicus]|nr:hypothetical protein [Candidatus Synoicihabitans palmerolidicus]